MTAQLPLLLGACALFAMTLAAYGADPAPTPQQMRDVELVAHRGESYDAPENTMMAINLAWDRGAEAVEMDLHLSADGKLVSIHDKDTLRVTGGPKRGGVKKVVKETSADELQKLDVGSWKAPPFKGERLPLIDEVLASLPKDHGRRLFIEIKVGPEAAAPLVEALKRAGAPAEQTAVISFNYETCKAVKRMKPELKVYFLSDFKQDKKTKRPPPTIDELIKQAKDANLDGLDLSYKGPLNADGVKRIHDAGLECYVWTIDDMDVAKRFIAYGVDGVTTNRPTWMRDQLDAAADAAGKSK